MNKILIIKQKILLSGNLSVYNSNKNLLMQGKNQITNKGASCIANGYGVKNISYLAVGRGLTTATREDIKLENEFTRYPITTYQISNGVAVMTINIDDNLSNKIDEWGLFMNTPDKISSVKDSGILFSRIVSPLQRTYKQKLMVEWRISLQ